MEIKGNTETVGFVTVKCEKAEHEISEFEKGKDLKYGTDIRPGDKTV